MYLQLYVRETQLHLETLAASLRRSPPHTLSILRSLHTMKGMSKALQIWAHVLALETLEQFAEEKKWVQVKKNLQLFRKNFRSWTKRHDFWTPPEATYLSDLLSDLGTEARRKRVGLVVIHDAALPPGNEALLYRWLTCLLNNALAHAFSSKRKTSEPPPLITLAIRKKKNSWSLRVTDNGKGVLCKQFPLSQKLSKKDLTQLTKWLTKTGRTTARKKTRDAGRGLGLSTLRQEVEENGGHFSLLSTGKTGTCFEISLPISKNSHPT